MTPVVVIANAQRNEPIRRRSATKIVHLPIRGQSSLCHGPSADNPRRVDKLDLSQFRPHGYYIRFTHILAKRIGELKRACP